MNVRKVKYGYLWQGEEEGLVCNLVELLASYGAPLDLYNLQNLTSPQAIAALTQMVSWIAQKTSPADVLQDSEDATFAQWQNSQVAFLRNWPYDFVRSNKRNLPINKPFLPIGQIGFMVGPIP